MSSVSYTNSSTSSTTYNNNNNHWQNGSSNLSQNQKNNNNNGGGGLPTTTTMNPENSGPRAKCDQVIFEAIAKATEIIVHGRAAPSAAGGGSRGGGGGGGSSMMRILSPQQPQLSLYGGGGGDGMLYNNNNNNHYMNSSSNNSTTSSSRFNLTVPEHPGVRQILQRWKYTKSIALRLDLHYQNADINHQKNNNSNDDDDDQRELLERWCIEYIPKSHDLFSERECRASDPIVQLRHVCKKIVLWLRNLYCSSRLLPSQAFAHPCCAPGNIGVSIYVVAQGADDVSDLHQHRGFASQKQPSTVLTPYGELVWQVHYLPKEKLEPFLPPNHPYKAPLGMPRTPSMARPIRNNNNSSNAVSAPVAIPQNNNSNSNQYYRDAAGTPPTQQQQPSSDRYIGMPQSAPAGVRFMSSPPPGRHSNGAQQSTQQQQQQQHPRNTYHASSRQHLFHRSNSDHVNDHDSFQPYQRRNTSIGIERHHSTNSNNNNNNNNSKQVHQNDMEHPERLLSGLSLALMSENAKQGGAAGGTDDPDAVEKRRLALHHAPPQHWSDSSKGLSHSPDRHHHQQQQQHNKSEYGYAYNNHIAWNQIRPSPSVPIPSKGDGNDGYYYNTSSNQNNNNNAEAASGGGGGDGDGRLSRNSYSPGRLGSSPSFLAGTPPSGAFLRTPGSLGAASSSGPPSSLIPPRNAAAPPFVRPMGFLQAPDASPSVATAADPQQQQQKHSAGEEGEDPAADTHQQQQQQGGNHYAPPMTSLDLLHCSPFQQGVGGSALSSLSLGYGPTASNSMNPQNSFLRPGGFHSASSLMPSPLRDGGGGDNDNTSAFGGGDYDDGGAGIEYDMPFAVDDSVSTVDHKTAAAAASMTQQQQQQPGESTPMAMNSNSHSAAGNSFAAGTAGDSSLGHLGSSAAVASFAQKCAPSQHRLKLFESVSNASHQSQNAHNSGGGQSDSAAANGFNGGTQHQGSISGSLRPATSSLTDQLAEFRDFGASLSLSHQLQEQPHHHHHASSSASEDASGSTGTPIPMQS